MHTAVKTRQLVQRGGLIALLFCFVLVGGLATAQDGINRAADGFSRADGDAPSPLDRAALQARMGEYARESIVESAPTEIGETFESLRPTGSIDALVILEGDPAGAILLNRENPEALFPQVAAQSQSLMQTQNALANTLQSGFGINTRAQITFVANALQVRMDASQIEAVEALPGVAAVIPDQIGFLTSDVDFAGGGSLDNSNSVPFVGGQLAWAGGLTGAGVTIGIIDSGIDYTHAMFGGSGSVATYTANVTNDITDIGFDGSRVVGGYDFVGDAWDAGLALIPDDDPIDCNGHGSHVAGTAAGNGVASDGSAYTGPYDATTPVDSMRIGPGVAPEAIIYAFKIGGCGPAVSFTAAINAIDWVLDPNRDGSIDDRLDVTNNSYGGFFGSPAEALTQAFDIASAAGTLMVGSAGNSGDTYFINGDPNIAETSIAVASSINDTLYGGLQIDSGPTGDFASYPTVIPANPSVGGATGTFGSFPLRLVGGVDNTQGCDVADYAGFAGEAGLIVWSAAASGCGSDVRMTNAVSAGGVSGLVVVSASPADFPFINLACRDAGGVSSIPCVSITNADGSILAANPGAFNVTFDSSLSAALNDSVGDTLSSFTSRGPRMAAGSGQVILKPDMTAPGDAIFSTSVGTGTEGVTLGGTSMAAPHVAGAAALLRELRPGWNNYEIKARLMNTALNDLWTGINQTGDNYGVSRVGSGRLNVTNARADQVIAYHANSPRRVNVSFSVVGATQPVTRTETISVANLGSTPASYNVSFEQRNDSPMAQFSVSPSSINVGPGETATVTVSLTVDPTAANPHSQDPTKPADSIFGFANFWMTEEGGYVRFDNTSGGSDLRVAVHAVPRPESEMGAESNTVVAGPQPIGSAGIPLAGIDVDTGFNSPFDVFSVVSAFELLYEAPNDDFIPQTFDRAEIQYVGMSSDLPFWLDLTGGDLNAAVANATLYLAIATYGDWSTPAPYEIYFETAIDVDGDGTFDLFPFNWDIATPFGADTSDAFIHFIDVGGPVAAPYINELPPFVADTNVFNTNVIVLPIPMGFIGLSGADTDIDFSIFSAAELRFSQPDAFDFTPTLTYDPLTSPVSFQDLGGSQGGPFPGMSWYPDFDGGFVPVDYDLSLVDPANPPRILLLHHHNGSGQRAEVVTLTTGNVADLTARVQVDNPVPQEGDSIFFAMQADNVGPASSVDIVMRGTLPTGLTYVSDNCANGSTVTSNSPTTVECVMTVPGQQMPAGEVMGFEIAATVDGGTTGQRLNFQVSAEQGTTVVDPNMDNNTAVTSVCVGLADPNSCVPPGAAGAAGVAGAAGTGGAFDLPVTELPATGETPWWRDALLIGAIASGVGLALLGLFMVLRRLRES